jgi:hypothetical protein
MEHFQVCVSSISVGNTSENTRKTRLHDRLDWLAFCAASRPLLFALGLPLHHINTQSAQWKPHVRPARR